MANTPPEPKGSSGLPPGWAPNESERKVFIDSTGVTPEKLDEELVKFRFYYTMGTKAGKVSTTRGWRQAFFNWLKNSIRFEKEAARRGPVFSRSRYLEGLKIL